MLEIVHESGCVREGVCMWVCVSLCRCVNACLYIYVYMYDMSYIHNIFVVRIWIYVCYDIHIEYVTICNTYNCNIIHVSI